ncbi:hypothetical protein CQA61_29920, partial [Klebsiella pneumoniae]
GGVGACNELTQDNLDPISKTPETKYCAVKVEAISRADLSDRINPGAVYMTYQWWGGRLQ